MDRYGCRFDAVAVVAVSVLAAGCAAAPSSSQGYQGTANDYMQIEQLFAKYSYDINIGDGEAWANDFTPGGVFQDPSRCAIGHKALSDVPGHDPKPGKDLKDFHFSVPGPILYLDKDHATVHSTVMIIAETGAGKTGGVTITGTYDDKLTRQNGQWKYAYRFVQRPNRSPPVPCAPQAQNGFTFAEWP